MYRRSVSIFLPGSSKTFVWINNYVAIANETDIPNIDPLSICHMLYSEVFITYTYKAIFNKKTVY